MSVLRLGNGQDLERGQNQVKNRTQYEDTNHQLWPGKKTEPIAYQGFVFFMFSDI